MTNRLKQDFARVANDLLHISSRTGWAGAVGLGLFALALAWELSGNQAARGRIDEVTHARSELRRATHDPATLGVSPREQLSAFYNSFPRTDSLPDILLQFHRSALKHQLSPLRASYRESSEPGTPLTRVRITIPVQGGYASIRGWLDDTLLAMPQAGIDGIEFKRKDTGTEQLEAQVRFVIFLRSKQ